MDEPTLVTALALPAGVVVAAAVVATAAGRAPLLETARHLVAQPRRLPARDAALTRLGVTLLPVAAVLAATVLPLGARPLVDLDAGLVWFNAAEVLGWVAVWTAGWGPNAALGLVGGYRMLALGLAYELPHMLALVAPAIGASSLRVTDVVAAQHGLWFAVVAPVALLLFLASTLAMSAGGPFDAPVAPDLAGGAAAELTGVDRLLLSGGRWMLLTVAAAMAVPLFLGGGAPLLGLAGPAWAWTAGKTVVVLAALLLARRRLPRLRTERVARIGWLVLTPLGVAQALVVSLVALPR